MQSRSAYDCFSIATTSLELARRVNEQWEKEHHSVIGIVFVAFAIEAMLNHYGRIYDKDWNLNERKESRKRAHERIFRYVNLPNYLESLVYQNAKICFELRDLLAHGKTEDETIEVPIEVGSSFSIFDSMMALKSKPFREVSYELLESFVDTARDIERDIEEHGYYPNQEHIECEYREKLSECPLSATGIRYT